VYPVCLQLKDKLCVVIGGGGVAERKVREILIQQGKVRLVSPALSPKLQTMASGDKVVWLRKEYEPEDLNGAFLVYAATSSRAVQKRIQRDANAANQLINIADDPEGSSFHVPASIHRGDLTLAISTNGKSPAMSAMVRKQLEHTIGEEYGVLLNLVAAIRSQILAGDEGQQQKRILFQKILHQDIIGWIKNDQWELVEEHINNVLGTTVEVNWKDIRENRL
jgi:precorrin-2 dehydrogenase/sirohydrochlorin ferrochelatase